MDVAATKPSLKNSLAILWKEVGNKISDAKAQKKAKSENYSATVLSELRSYTNHYKSYPPPLRNYISFLIQSCPAWSIAGVPSLAHHYSAKISLTRWAKKKTAIAQNRRYLKNYGRKRSYSRRRSTRTYRKRSYGRKRRIYRRRRYYRR